MIYSKALLYATYIDGKAANPRTPAHEQAECHPFKTEYLFKTVRIPREGYEARLIQHLVIIDALEKRLQHFSNEERTAISAFFAISYLDGLWRSPGIQKDLEQLGRDSAHIKKQHLALSTQDYVNRIEQLPPKHVLAHFLMHVAGFMHGGNIIRSKYIRPSNDVTDYQITAHQYDFSYAGKTISFRDLMSQVDNIPLDETEYAAILAESEQVYTTMTQIYDDLWKMHVHQPGPLLPTLAIIAACVAAVSLVLRLMIMTNSLNINWQSPGQP